jgi:hypothetical protein
MVGLGRPLTDHRLHARDNPAHGVSVHVAEMGREGHQSVPPLPAHEAPLGAVASILWQVQASRPGRMHNMIRHQRTQFGRVYVNRRDKVAVDLVGSYKCDPIHAGFRNRPGGRFRVLCMHGSNDEAVVGQPLYCGV